MEKERKKEEAKKRKLAIMQIQGYEVQFADSIEKENLENGEELYSCEDGEYEDALDEAPDSQVPEFHLLS